LPCKSVEERTVQFRIFGRVVTLNFRVTKIEEPVLGIRSNLDNKSIYNDGLHILMLDCDDVPKEVLVDRLIKLQHRFKLGDATVMKSSLKTIYWIEINSSFPFVHFMKKKIIKRHIYFFGDPMIYWDAFKIIHFATNELKIVDEAYSRWRGIRPNMVLRTSPKSDGFVPEEDFVIKSPFVKPEIKWFRDFVEKMLMGEIKNRGDEK
jgi:hypothetical protein